MKWFRWYNGTMSDPKWRVIARRAGVPVHAVVAVWAAVLENASDATERGTLERFDPEATAAALDLETEQVEAIIAAMDGRVLDGETVTAWERRQPKREDGSAERARAWRERRRAEKADSERPRTDANATERPREEKSREETTTTACLLCAGGRDDDQEHDEASRVPTPTAAEVPPSDVVLEVITTANAAQRLNPAIDQARYRPIPAGHGKSVQQIADWLNDGITLDTIVEVVQERCGAYQPSDRSRQINSLTYLDGAVREEHSRRTIDTSGHTPTRGRLPRRSPDPGEYVPTTQAVEF